MIGRISLTMHDSRKWTYSELVTPNAGFETVTAVGPPANFANWSETVGGGNIEAETVSVNSGLKACKCTSGADHLSFVFRTLSVVAGVYTIQFRTRGDGTNAGRYEVLDSTHVSDLIALTSTGVTGTTYTLVSRNFTAPAGTLVLTIYFVSPVAVGGIAYFDDISVKRAMFA